MHKDGSVYFNKTTREQRGQMPTVVSDAVYNQEEAVASMIDELTINIASRKTAQLLRRALLDYKDKLRKQMASLGRETQEQVMVDYMSIDEVLDVVNNAFLGETVMKSADRE